jgi:hypothetical protein
MCLTSDQVLAATGAEPLLANLGQDTIIIADKAYDADRLGGHIKARGATANIPDMIRRKKLSLDQSSLSRAQSRRTLLQQTQSVPSRRDSQRQARCELPSFYPARRCANLAPLN